MKTKILLILGYITLVGCASNQQFDCPLKGGIRCQSMREIEKLIDTGKLGEDQQSNIKHKISYDSHTSLRLPEEVIEIWLAPYEANGIYHHPTLLNTVIKPAKWRK